MTKERGNDDRIIILTRDRSAGEVGTQRNEG
jgi:hypothetical protein